jgi:integrase
MAAVEKRENKDGTTTYWVRWRQPGESAKQNEPFTGDDPEDSRRRAERFKLDVELAGGRWPKLYFPRVGYVSQSQWDKLMTPAEQDAQRRAAVPLLDYCRDRVGRLTGIQARTRSDYFRLIENYIAPFGAFQRADVADPDTLSDDHVAEWINWLEAGEADPDDEGAWLRAPKSPKTIANVHGLLYQCLEHAVRRERPLRKVNPCATTRLPKLDDRTGEEMVFLTPQECGILWRAADPLARDVITIALGTAARFGEFTAFQCGDFDFATTPAAARIDRAWKRTNLKAERLKLGPPKSDAGRRTVTLDQITVEAVQRRIGDRAPSAFLLLDRAGRHLTHGTFYGPHWQPTLYKAVRCEQHRQQDRDEGRLIKGEMVRYVSRRQLSMQWIVPCGCPGTLRKVPRIHDLRHTAVSILIAKNVPLSAIARRVGHESIVTTDKVYGHLLPELDTRQADAMLGALQHLSGLELVA